MAHVPVEPKTEASEPRPVPVTVETQIGELIPGKGPHGLTESAFRMIGQHFARTGDDAVFRYSPEEDNTVVIRVEQEEN